MGVIDGGLGRYKDFKGSPPARAERSPSHCWDLFRRQGKGLEALDTEKEARRSLS